MQKNVLFDLDGTLLPMDLQQFIELYLQAFCRRFAQELQLDPHTLVKGIWDGADAMAKNDGSCLNRELFWQAMSLRCGRDMRQYEEAFDGFYRKEFVEAKRATWVNPCAAATVRLLKKRGCRLIVATNPLFPEAATFARLRWAGLDPKDFDRVTLYDNCTFSKPDLRYYREICDVCGISPEESLMVGNDVDEDMCASQLGFDTYLITDCLINRSGKDISRYPHGSFDDFYRSLSGQNDAKQ